MCGESVGRTPTVRENPMSPYEGDDDKPEAKRNRYEDFDRSAKFYAHPERGAIIAEAKATTFAWLEIDKESYRPNGDLVEEPFFPEPEPTDDAILNEGRGQMLRARVWEHGLQKKLNVLVKKGIFLPLINGNPKSVLVEIATDPMTSVVVRELVTGYHAGSPHDISSLADLMKLYRYVSGKGSRFRESHLCRLAAFGLVTVRADKSGYAIKAGPVGRAFYIDVYLPIVQHFSKKGGF